ncbi:hypothetical protein BT63DRAFT_415062 [Microthyrium microscopicum]|uniref:Glutaredoxin-like protein n=1 Tax=Microthyrium microscopicum TaxID=703497 RepID=A0A6A6U5S7_9PEZI|nr:hypothetical protein BT63DRAFT_415062 [Microthyrium microscopicum]
MYVARPLLRITLFTREHCSLCTQAKFVLDKVQTRNPFQYAQFDVMKSGNEKWRIYEFDVPVIHIEKANGPTPWETSENAKKLMHRFSQEDVEAAMDEVSV